VPIILEKKIGENGLRFKVTVDKLTDCNPSS
jgi:hypothetical protein